MKPITVLCTFTIRTALISDYILYCNVEGSCMIKWGRKGLDNWGKFNFSLVLFNLLVRYWHVLTLLYILQKTVLMGRKRFEFFFLFCLNSFVYFVVRNRKSSTSNSRQNNKSQSSHPAPTATALESLAPVNHLPESRGKHLSSFCF